MKYGSGMALVVAVWGAAAAARAEPWGLGVHVQTPAGGNLERERFLGLGGQLAYQVMDLYSFELAVSDYEAANKDRTNSVLSIRSVAGTARAHLGPWSGWLGAYAGAGVGAYALDESAADGADAAATFDDRVRVRPHVSIGLELTPGRRIEWFVEYRYTFHQILFQDAFDHGLVRVGVNYLF